jgi:hypothetical protein
VGLLALPNIEIGLLKRMIKKSLSDRVSVQGDAKSAEE